MADNRLDRELETREKTARKTAWKRPEVLPSPIKKRGMYIVGLGFLPEEM